VRGLRAEEPTLDNLALELKRLCGAGGTVRDGAIEVQGDHRERIAERLRALGYSVKLAGG
jgi:translation initiation factor 1